MKAPRPCLGVKRRDCSWDEDQYVRGNKGDEEELRASHRRFAAHGVIPPACPKCGWHHKPVAADG